VTHRERVLATLRFEETDRVACDLMESAIWPELMDYFRSVRGLSDEPAVRNCLDTDFRWVETDYYGPERLWVPVAGLSDAVNGSYSAARCVVD
jgi:hypothetical protein